MSYKSFLLLFGGLTVVFTLLRFVAVDYWWVRFFDFPHVQLTILSIAAFIIYFVKFDLKRINDYIFSAIMLACMLFQVVKIYTYTPLAPYEIKDATVSNPVAHFSLFTSNVLQKNEKKKRVISEIKKNDADVVLLTETDASWQKAISASLSDSYRYKVEVPLPNTYGMLLYSKKELFDTEIAYKVDDSIPSIHAKIILSQSDTIQLYAIHPTPPMPQHNSRSSDRDTEMMKTALLAMESKLPVIAAGDFNDVAWSETTTLFQRVSGLLDPRKGRGLFNTFNAKNPLLRWPLDHIFIGPEFRVVTMMRGKDVNSDHFPMFAKFSLEPKLAEEQRLKPPTASELKRAAQQMK